MNKRELRKLIAAAGIKQWELAEELGIREEALSRKLRHELSLEDEAAVKNAVKEISRRMEQTDAEDQS